jgi:hypothetical protein
LSFLPEKGDSLAHALGSVIANTTVVLGFDGAGKTYDPAIPQQFNTLKTLNPGLGYWVKLSAADTLIYPESSLMPVSMNSGAMTASNRVSVGNVKATGEWISVWGDNVSLHGRLLPSGTAIVAKTSAGVVCGSGIAWADGKFGLMPIYRDDASTEEVEGAKQGEAITLVIGDYQVPKTIRWTELGAVVNLSDVVSGIAEMSAVPMRYELQQNYPNPFNPTTTIRYALPQSAQVKLKVYDVLGKEVAVLVDQAQPAGYYDVQWNAMRMSSGVYFYHIDAGDYHRVMKMQVIK